MTAGQDDTCRIVDIDGTPVRVRGAADMDATDRAMLGEVVAAARRKHEQETPTDRAALTCPVPNCGHRKQARQYLCRGCWATLPRHARTALSRRDDKAMRRLSELLDQVRDGVPLHQVRVQP
ncbi:hypothetical protein SAMN04489712_105260 [Thermomonospora echinospora]|uniref:Uncharacterized protein n=1 Tax=Thermomonospora echinospora TaxID=1992 RepID=A0A1H6A785_9ACTN|nr:hypothetical protein [Thermomonospora echinospora]SEG44599.1 hypothetical protein SAMN04489712_105260 [Thermomonospora echinospora]